MGNPIKIIRFDPQDGWHLKMTPEVGPKPSHGELDPKTNQKPT